MRGCSSCPFFSPLTHLSRSVQLKSHIHDLKSVSENLAQELRDLERREEMLVMSSSADRLRHHEPDPSELGAYDSLTWKLRERNRSSAVDERLASSGTPSSSSYSDQALYSAVLGGPASRRSLPPFAAANTSSSHFESPFSPSALAQARRENTEAASSLVEQLRQERERVAAEVEKYAIIEEQRMRSLQESQSRFPVFLLLFAPSLLLPPDTCCSFSSFSSLFRVLCLFFLSSFFSLPPLFFSHVCAACVAWHTTHSIGTHFFPQAAKPRGACAPLGTIPPQRPLQWGGRGRGQSGKPTRVVSFGS